MATQYDAIAERYRDSKDSPVRRYVERPTILGLAGDVRGMRVLDLACGDGHYTRELARRGASVVGVDISPEMVRLAREAESRSPLGIEYHCADAASLPALGNFDLVTAAYLLHYAPDLETLRRMCVNIADCLQQGGRFVAINENPSVPEERDGEYAAYGFCKRLEGPLREGQRIRYEMLAGRESFGFSVYWYSADAYASVLAAAGLRDASWSPLQMDDAGVAVTWPGYFDAYLGRPPVLGLTCLR
jgi:SAM-dependent methyltransferase